MYRSRKRIGEAEEEDTRLSGPNSVSVDESLHQDLCGIMKEENDRVKNCFPEGTFRRLFWDEQLKAAQ